MGLTERLESVSILETNLRPPVTVRDDVTVRDAVIAMRQAGLGCVVVTDRDRKAVGMFTEGILRHCLNESADALDQPIASQMVTRLPWVSPSESVSVILDAMQTNNMRFLAVLDDDRHVVGLTGQKSLMEFIGDEFAQEILTQDPTSVSFSRKKEGA